MYRAVIDFTDDKDRRRHVYRVGDAFPREGVEITDERLDYLLGDENKFCAPVIELMEEGNAPQKKPLNQMNKAELTEKATALGIEVPPNAKNDDIKAIIEALQADQ